MATLLANMQDVFGELGLPSPAAVVSSTDDSVLQMLSLMNRVGNMLATERDWQALAKEHRFTTVYYQYTGNTTAGSTTISSLSSTTGLSTDFMVAGEGVMQDTFIDSVGAGSVTINTPATATAIGVTLTFSQARYSMPSDYARMGNKTQYDKSNQWAVVGPESPQEWQWLKASDAATGPGMRFRIMGGKYVVWPAPTATVVLAFEYVSNGWVVSSGGTAKSKFTADDDTSVFPDQLLVLGTKLKFFEIKGFDTTTLVADFARELSKYKAQEAGADTLSLAPRRASVLLTQDNLPDTGYGNTTA